MCVCVELRACMCVCVELRVRVCVCGRRVHLVECVWTQDKASTIGKQWIQFREAFGRQDAALLFHLTNHYALIYAVREWTNTDGTAVRQILTTRRGQRPTVWMDWAEVRDIVIKWAGYKVIIVERGSADTWA